MEEGLAVGLEYNDESARIVAKVRAKVATSSTALRCDGRNEVRMRHPKPNEEENDQPPSAAFLDLAGLREMELRLENELEWSLRSLSIGGASSSQQSSVCDTVDEDIFEAWLGKGKGIHRGQPQHGEIEVEADPAGTRILLPSLSTASDEYGDDDNDGDTFSVPSPSHLADYCDCSPPRFFASIGHCLCCEIFTTEGNAATAAETMTKVKGGEDGENVPVCAAAATDSDDDDGNDNNKNLLDRTIPSGKFVNSEAQQIEREGEEEESATEWIMKGNKAQDDSEDDYDYSDDFDYDSFNEGGSDYSKPSDDGDIASEGLEKDENERDTLGESPTDNGGKSDECVLKNSTLRSEHANLGETIQSTQQMSAGAYASSFTSVDNDVHRGYNQVIKSVEKEMYRLRSAVESQRDEIESLRRSAACGEAKDTVAEAEIESLNVDFLAQIAELDTEGDCWAPTTSELRSFSIEPEVHAVRLEKENALLRERVRKMEKSGASRWEAEIERLRGSVVSHQEELTELEEEHDRAQLRLQEVEEREEAREAALRHFEHLRKEAESRARKMGVEVRMERERADKIEKKWRESQACAEIAEGERDALKRRVKMLERKLQEEGRQCTTTSTSPSAEEELPNPPSEETKRKLEEKVFALMEELEEQSMLNMTEKQALQSQLLKSIMRSRGVSMTPSQPQEGPSLNASGKQRVLHENTWWETNSSYVPSSREKAIIEKENDSTNTTSGSRAQSENECQQNSPISIQPRSSSACSNNDTSNIGDNSREPSFPRSLSEERWWVHPGRDDYGPTWKKRAPPSPVCPSATVSSPKSFRDGVGSAPYGDGLRCRAGPQRRPKRERHREDGRAGAGTGTGETFGSVRCGKSSGSATSHYDVLGVERGVTKAEIKRAYRLLVLKHHPDKKVRQDNDAGGKRGDNGESNRVSDVDADDPNRMFRLVTDAYRVLGDETERRLYDAQVQ